ncbi:putative c2hc5 finger protein [Phaeomoniella chlamydospora]|uniref:Putative c2hc5 finger protein n=1 Tax=Phaeomoniella chlamydospora TaxID=158046 RepID=A0A0G2ELH1_PHACM|nr:putative c2hc5 finger protein [Phaeomoniella chlamydospora]
MTEALVSWATPRLARLLPLDDQSISELLQYTAGLSKDEGAEHLKTLLGDSPPALEFISTFNARRQDVAPQPQSVRQSQGPSDNVPKPRNDSDRVPASRKQSGRKPRASLHTAGPVRRPADYGDVAGGYRKSTMIDDEYAAPTPNCGGHTTSLSDALTFSQQPTALQAPRVTSTQKTPSPLPSQDPSPPRQKLPPSASGPLISDLPNIKAKQSKKPTPSGKSTPNKTSTTTTASIDNLTSAIAALELSTSPSLRSARRKCGCHATIHPLFEPAPNCLSCGQIICGLEGLQPCSFCDSPILTPQQVQTMIRALREERGNEKMSLHNAAVSHSGRGTPALGGTPESSGDEMSQAAAKARAHRDRLLAFQRENAQRTKVHDEAADYDMTVTPGATQWMSPAQRALALKKQQKYLRELEEQNRPEWEKRKTVMSMSIKNGKLVRSYETVKEDRPADTELEHEEVVEEDLGPTGQKGAFGKNPLLASGGLVRPVWKGLEDGKGKGRAKESRARKQTWRRVQDDKDDNEQWILDGGVYGPGGGGT